MTLSNTYVLDVDLKRQMTSRTPTFKKGDNGVLIFRLFDDGILYPINDAVKATLNIVSPSGILYEEETLLMTYEGARVVRYVFIEDVMLESGNYSASLTLEEDNGNKVSIQPFNIVIYNDVKGGINSVMDLVRSLQDRINNLISDLNQTIKLSEKGQPNGVATLDINGRIPQSQLPTQLDSIISHINHTVWSNQVHGIRITKDGDDSGELPGTIQYFYPPLNKWQNINFAPSATGSGSGSQYLDVELTKSNGIVTLNYIGVPTVELQKWDYEDRNKSHFSLNGTTFSGNTIIVDRIGLYTLYYRDSNGVEYVKLFNVATEDLEEVDIFVSVDGTVVTVNISTGTSIKKWDKGSRNIGYFQSQGNVFTGNTFSVTDSGVHTIYYKTNNGAEYVYEFEVSSDNLLDATVTMGLSSSQNYIRVYKAPILTNNTGGNVAFTTTITDSPIPGSGNILNDEYTMATQNLKSLIPSEEPKTLYYHFTLKKDDLTKVITEPVKFGYHTANTTSTLSSLSRGELFRIDGYDDGHFMKINSGSSNIQVIHIPTSSELIRQWGGDIANNTAYGFEMNRGIGQYLNNDYYNALPSSIRNSIINYNFKQKNPIGNEIIEINAKVGFIDETYALSQSENLNSDLSKAGAISCTVLTTRPYPDYVGSYGLISAGTKYDGSTIFDYRSNLGDKYREWWFTPMFVIGNGSSVTVRKLTNTSGAVVNQL